MRIADEAAYMAQQHRAWNLPDVTLDVGKLEALAVAALQRDRLLVYASHRRGCLSTLPCVCGLDALLREVSSA